MQQQVRGSCIPGDKAACTSSGLFRGLYSSQFLSFRAWNKLILTYSYDYLHPNSVTWGQEPHLICRLPHHLLGLEHSRSQLNLSLWIKGHRASPCRTLGALILLPLRLCQDTDDTNSTARRVSMGAGFAHFGSEPQRVNWLGEEASLVQLSLRAYLQIF